ncbi:MAG: type II toxin-antitoxin system tRNA(fMet)-specific endonuclease VapC [Alphaproteobacteria bacterium]|nr:MAG: hypothetical protein B6I23_02385 [Rickettsiaceae bacterium 4572_127]
MKYMLDTDICSYIIKKNPEKVLKKFQKIGADKICISVITYSELLFGAEKHGGKKLKERVNLFLSLTKVLDFDCKSAVFYSKLRAKLEKKGSIIENMDLLIASCCLGHKCILVSNNIKHFLKIKKLKLENWI